MTGGLNRGEGAKDKISSWVYSQSDEPPEPPEIARRFASKPTRKFYLSHPRHDSTHQS
jgi:hypothetical protein